MCSRISFFCAETDAARSALFPPAACAPRQGETPAGRQPGACSEALCEGLEERWCGCRKIVQIAHHDAVGVVNVEKEAQAVLDHDAHLRKKQSPTQLSADAIGILGGKCAFNGGLGEYDEESERE